MIDVDPTGTGGTVLPSVKAEEAPSSAPKASACTAARHRSVPAICANATYPRTEVGRMRRWEAGGAAQRCVRRKHCCVSACCLGPIFVRRFDRQVICKPHEESQNIYCRVACVSRQGHGNLQFATRVSPRAPFPSLSVVGVRARLWAAAPAGAQVWLVGTILWWFVQ